MQKRLSIAEGTALFKGRFAGTGINYQHVAKSLTWFADAESEPDPRLLMQTDWLTVKKFFDSHSADFAAAFALMAAGECGKVVLFPDPAEADGPLTTA